MNHSNISFPNGNASKLVTICKEYTETLTFHSRSFLNLSGSCELKQRSMKQTYFSLILPVYLTMLSRFVGDIAWDKDCRYL